MAGTSISTPTSRPDEKASSEFKSLGLSKGIYQTKGNLVNEVEGRMEDTGNEVHIL